MHLSVCLSVFAISLKLKKGPLSEFFISVGSDQREKWLHYRGDQVHILGKKS